MKERATPKEVERLVREIRSAFQEMATVVTLLHAGIGVTGASRALLEHLTRHGACTVPDIARAKSVSRQHIQQLADGLVSDGLAVLKPNPAHKRSSLLKMTPAGETLFATIRAREAAPLAQISAQLDHAQVKAGTVAVAALREAFAKLEI